MTDRDNVVLALKVQLSSLQLETAEHPEVFTRCIVLTASSASRVVINGGQNSNFERTRNDADPMYGGQGTGH